MNIKIADFGLATQINDEKKHFTMCGTPNFISPEIASRNAHGLEADVWSLGCMMYTFLTGKPPFDTEGIRNTLNKVVLAEFDMPNYLSNEAQDLISCLLRKNPMDRIPLTNVLEHPFMSLKTRRMIQQISLPSLSSNTKSINSFNESIDSGRGTMTTTTALSSSNSSGSGSSTVVGNHPMTNKSFPILSRNLATLQSGQEQDFIYTNNNNTNHSSSSYSVSSSNHSPSNISNNHHNQSPLQSNNAYNAYQQKLANNPSHTDASSDSSKNLYYNQFLKQQQQHQHILTSNLLILLGFGLLMC